MDHAKLRRLMNAVEPTILRELESQGVGFVLLLIPRVPREIAPSISGRDVAILSNVPVDVLRNVLQSVADDDGIDAQAEASKGS